MTASSLPAALRACAAGICTHEAGVSLLIANRTFLSRDDFTNRFITRDTRRAHRSMRLTGHVRRYSALPVFLAPSCPARSHRS